MQARLIPRNNWDYGLGELVQALWAKLSPVGSSWPQSLPLQNPILTGSGRASLYAILRALDLPRGAKIGVPLFCCSVVFDAIRQAGCTPRFLDIDEQGFNLSPSDLARKAEELAAVVVVHMFGQPADVEAIRTAAKGLPLIEDCAQALFSSHKGRVAGTMGDAAFFSFRSGKYLSAGCGSAVFASDPTLQAKIREHVTGFVRPTWSRSVIHAFTTYIKSALYRRPWYGLVGLPLGRRLDRRLNLTAKGGFELDAMPAGDWRVASQRLMTFASCIEKQRVHAERLLAKLRLPGVALPKAGAGGESNWFQFPLRFQQQDHRDAMSDYLFRHGIDAAKYLDDIVDVAKTDYSYAGDCPYAEAASRTTLLIPIYYTLTDRDLDHIATMLNRGVKALQLA